MKRFYIKAKFLTSFEKLKDVVKIFLHSCMVTTTEADGLPSLDSLFLWPA